MQPFILNSSRLGWSNPIYIEDDRYSIQQLGSTVLVISIMSYRVKVLSRISKVGLKRPGRVRLLSHREDTYQAQVETRQWYITYWYS